MLFKESEWFKEKIESYLSKSDCILNIGSSTLNFRKNIQPYIHKNIFNILDKKAIKVYHVDIKSDAGVDLVGDVTNDQFISSLKKIQPTAIICANLLEHLENREFFCKALMKILSPGGLLFLSCPYHYPFHPDPIDTMYRPLIQELANEFPETTFVEGEILDCGTKKVQEYYFWKYYRLQWLRTHLKMLIKLLLPFYRPKKWWHIIREVFITENQSFSVTCAILKKS